MKTIAHISDLHFGREDPAVVAGLREELHALRPSLVAVSGDLTQRARRAEFRAAAAFLAGLEAPWLAVPGNHDLPLFDVVRRLVDPLGRYRRFISSDPAPTVRLGELVVVGLCTARPDRWIDGALSAAQRELMRARFADSGEAGFRVLVTHHPFVPRPHDPHPALVGGGPEAVGVAAACGVDLLLSGHLHQGYLADVRAADPRARTLLVAQAGTAVSRRRRHEPNTYNLVTVDVPRLTIEVRLWNGRGFTPREAHAFRKGADGAWARDAQGQPAAV